MRPLALVSVLLTALPGPLAAQVNDPAAFARAVAVDACDGRPVRSARFQEGNRLSVTCGRGTPGTARDNAQPATGAGSLAPVASGGLLLLGLIGLGVAAGGGGSASGTD